MRIAVAGATGNIGELTVAALGRAGHDVVRLSRTLGVDLSIDGGELDRKLVGTQAVVDVTNAPPADHDETVRYFATTTKNLLAAEHKAGVAHHVLLSIVGLDRAEGNSHYAGKREQERLVAEGPVPWTIVPATMFHSFGAMMVGGTEQGGIVTLPPLLIQPIAPIDVADVLAEVVAGDPRGRYVDVAGPERQDLVDMARRTVAAQGRRVTLIPSWSGPFGLDMAGDVLLPDPSARLVATTFTDWLQTLS